ncbi:tol-pal system YbgF family protein [Methylovorus sp. MM2]|uniref:tetratricopeptide repeat protein n=1 Tax=Methylovorus sp. MM2 TaxID=1848038 RepID=UPI000829F7B4|nr:hypothetical protein [Methylovorus sp. MM2]
MANATHFSSRTPKTFTPFWRRLPSFFEYPLQVGAMIRIIGYSCIGGVLAFLLGDFGAIISLVLWLPFLKYAFLVTEHTANGRFDEPTDRMDSNVGNTGQVVRQFILFIILGLITALAVIIFGPEIGYISGLLLMIVLAPAGVMIIAATRSLLEALNPAKILFFIKTIGSPYLALCFILMSLSGSGEWLQEFFSESLDSWLVLPALYFISFYFALITYHMMGYVLYQYHEELGLTAAVSFEKAEAKLSPGKKAIDPLVSKLTMLIANGQQEEAIDLLRESIRTQWQNNDLHERYHKLLLAADKPAAALHHAREFITKLVNEKRIFQALDLCEQCLELDPDFQPNDSYQVHELATAANVAKRHKLALNLMRRFDKRYPSHPQIPAIYLLSAQILCEHFRKYKEAMQILQALQTKFPEHPIATEAKQYMQVINKLASIG